MEAFDHISKGIDKIYKQLTKSHTHPLGGTAYLNLENEDEPFLHGIKYTAMPPTKRFRDMEQLSGGEKTVAALALLFAIHRYTVSSNFPSSWLSVRKCQVPLLLIVLSAKCHKFIFRQSDYLLFPMPCASGEPLGIPRPIN
jgi:hypothetical protein